MQSYWVVAAKRKELLLELDHSRREACGKFWFSLYETEIAQGYVEVHHAATKVKDIVDGHQSTFDELQLPRANCHRPEHRFSRFAE